MPIAAIYTRGLNAPYTEGYVAVAASIARAMALTGWAAIVLNFKYAIPGRHEVTEETFNLSRASTFEATIPAIARERILHSPSFAVTAFASILECSVLPKLVAREMLARASLVHLVNCFMLPRALMRLVRTTPVLAHICQNPTALPLQSFPLPVDGFVASSRRIATILRSLHSRDVPIFTIPPAVESCFFGPIRNSHLQRKLILYVGNLSRKRFPNELLEVIRQIVRQDSATAFRLIAPVNRMNIERAREIIAMCRALAINDRVTVSLRNMDDREKLSEYSAASLFLFAPIHEFCEAIEPPLTVLEALACGLPTLATDTYSARDAVISGKNGFLVSLDDYPRLVERAIAMLQAHPNQWDMWSAQARKIAFDDFSLHSLARKLAVLHSAILDNAVRH